MQADKKPMYPECAHLKWSNVEDIEVDPRTLDAVNGNYDFLPLFNYELLEKKYIKKYSFKNSELLRCRWDCFRRRQLNISLHHHTLNVPERKDQHFYNHQIVNRPDLSPLNATSHRITFRPGPGMDEIGSLPIPADVGRKPTATTVKKPVKKAPKSPAAAALKKRKNPLQRK